MVRFFADLFKDRYGWDSNTNMTILSNITKSIPAYISILQGITVLLSTFLIVYKFHSLSILLAAILPISRNLQSSGLWTEELFTPQLCIFWFEIPMIDLYWMFEHYYTKNNIAITFGGKTIECFVTKQRSSLVWIMENDSNTIIRSGFTFAKLHDSICYKTGRGPWVKSQTQSGVFIINVVYAKK